MMSNNDIIEMLEHAICFTSSDVKEKHRVIEIAKMLTERDEPKKPKVNPFWFCESWDCPVCENMIFKKQRFCDHCGQRLDWRGEEDE